MKRKSLVFKLIATISITIFIVFFATGIILSYFVRQDYFNTEEQKLDMETNTIQEVAVKYQGDTPSDRENIYDMLHLISGYLEADILLVNSSGYVYGVSNNEYSYLYGKRYTSFDLNTLRNDNILEYKSGDNYIYCRGMYNSSGEFVGAIAYVIYQSNINKPIYDMYKIIWISVVIAVIILNIIFYFISKKFIIKPLESINDIAKDFSNGHFDKRVNIGNNDEIGDLAKTFNIMADSIEEAENNRREFISNISHELRSPITSIKGFITAILDGIIPKEKEKYYLNIANDEIMRLTRLVNDLLDLSAMQAGKMTFKLIKVDINSVIRMTAIKMGQKALEKNIKIDVSLEGKSLYVLADNDKIIQVLTNLIDNAIKYCNRDGKILVSTKIKNEKIIVSVYNNGPSINKDDVKYIWDRFYKADKSRTNKTSTGLGLPIVRNIILEHNEKIWIDNNDNGVTFSFTLKKFK
ncbi:MAG: HAMP domain-containing sensor histidine kinase [Clostridium perfringens]|nr:HAMP domain-containing sensor histidine kinase [Clostridium perfringens]